METPNSSSQRASHRYTLAGNPAWVHDTESIYGIAGKLALANALKMEEALAYLTADDDERQLPVYRSWSSFNPKVVGAKLGVHHQWLEPSFPSATDGAISLDEWCYRPLRYCPQCLQQGFHSIVHQSRAVRQCPAHLLDLQEVCPACGQLINPFEGRPWHCSECGAALTSWNTYDWIQPFARFPTGTDRQFWIRWAKRLAHRTDSVESASENTPINLVTLDYWRKNLRQLGFWYFQELQAILRGRMRAHLECALGSYVCTPRTHIAGDCLAARALQRCAHLVWQSGGALVWPTFNRRTADGIERYLLSHLFHRHTEYYLTDEPARQVMHELAQCYFASAFEVRLLRIMGQKFSAAQGWGLSDTVTWCVQDGRFLLTNAVTCDTMDTLIQLADECCSYPPLTQPGSAA